MANLIPQCINEDGVPRRPSSGDVLINTIGQVLGVWEEIAVVSDYSSGGVSSLDLSSVLSLSDPYVYETLMLVGERIGPRTNNVRIRMRAQSGGSFHTGASDYAYFYSQMGSGFGPSRTGTSSDSFMELDHDQKGGNPSDGYIGFTAFGHRRVSGTSAYEFTMRGHMYGWRTSSTISSSRFVGASKTKANSGGVTGFRLYANSGNITGKLSLYGLRAA